MTSRVSFAVAVLLFCSLSATAEANAARLPAASGATVARVPTHNVERPSWWRANDSITEWTLAALFIGPDVALAHIKTGGAAVWLATDRAGNVVGPLRIPTDVVWAGFGDGGVVYLGTNAGILSRSPSVDALRSRPPKVIDDLGDVDVWDAGGTTVAALNRADGVLLLSNDRGASFDTLIFDDRPKSIAVRSDNVVVVSGGALHVSNDGGTSWAVTQISLPKLSRRGQFIGGKDGECEEATLARDGRTWIPYVSSPPFWDWRKPFDASDIPTGMGKPIDGAHQLSPLAPIAKGKTALDVVVACRADRRNPGGFGTIGRGGRPLAVTGPDDPCAVTRCLQRPPLDAAARFLRNGRCGTKVARPLWSGFLSPHRKKVPAATLVATNNNECRQNGLAAPGRLVVPTAASIRLAEVSCRATRVVGKNGLTAVLCEDAKQPDVTNVLVANANTWEDEVRLKGRVRFAHQVGAQSTGADDHPRSVDDGTLLFEVEHNNKRSAWVRRPIDLGRPSAWRQVVVERAVAHRALTGGRVLVLAGSETQKLGALSVTASPFQPSTTGARVQWSDRATEVTLDQIRSCHAALVRKNPALQGRIDIRLLASRNGQVTASVESIPVDDVKWAQCVTDAFSQTRLFVVDHHQKRIIEDDVRASLHFKAENHMLDLWVDDDGKRVRIAHDVVVDGAVRDLRVRADRSIAFDVGPSTQAHWVTAPRTGTVSMMANPEGHKTKEAPKSARVDVESVIGPLPITTARNVARQQSESWGSCIDASTQVRPRPSDRTWRFKAVVSQHGHVLTTSNTPPPNGWRGTRCLERGIMNLRFPPTSAGISVVELTVKFPDGPVATRP